MIFSLCWRLFSVIRLFITAPRQQPVSLSVSLLAISLAISGCATVAPSSTSKAPAPHKVDYLQQALSAEFSMQRGELKNAYDGYFNLAKKTNDMASIERATHIAIAMNNASLIEKSTDLWLAIAPESAVLYPLRYQVFISSNRPERAAKTLEQAYQQAISLDFISAQINNNARLPERIATIAVSLHLLPAELTESIPVKIAQARLHFLLGNFIEAAEHTKLLIQTLPQAQIDADIYLILAFSQDQNQQTEDAIQTLELGLKHHPQRLSILSPLIEFEIKINRLEQAKEHYLHAKLGTSARNQLSLNYVSLLISFGHPQQALETLHTLNYDDTGLANRLHFLEANALALLDQKALAIPHLLKVTGVLQPNAINQLAAWLYDLDRPEEINALILLRLNRVQDLDQALAIIQFHEDKQHLPLAIELAQAMLERFPGADAIRYKKALMADSLGQWQETEAELRTLLEGNPNNAHYMNALGYTLLIRSTRQAEAMRLIEAAYELANDDPAIIDSLGWGLYLQGDFEQASYFLKKAWDIMPDPEIAAHFGESLWLQKQYDEANKIWLEALESSPNHPALTETLRRLNPSLLELVKDQES